MKIPFLRAKSTKRSKNVPKKLSLAERDGILWEASRQYMRGQITADELKKIELEYELPPIGGRWGIKIK